jgi:hypothetical protein
LKIPIENIKDDMDMMIENYYLDIGSDDFKMHIFENKSTVSTSNIGRK